MNREILFRAKPKAWKTNFNYNKWIEGFYLKRQETTYCFTEDYKKYPVKTLHFIAEECMTDWGLPNDFRFYEIDPDTLCQYTEWDDRHKTKIFEKDVVEITSSSKHSDKYLIWWNREMDLMEAVPLSGIEFNGCDYWNGHYPCFHYETFCTMLQDPWGDFSDVKVIGNIIENPELIKEK